MTAPTLRIEVRRSISPAERAAVLALASAATATDGVSPIDDRVRIDLEFSGSPDTRHLLATRLAGSAPEELVGYSHLRDEPAGARSGHLVVHPERRRVGVATALLQEARQSTASTQLQVWAHGDGRPARSAAARLGFVRARELWQMRAPLRDLPQPSYPRHVNVRTFDAERDPDAWVALNAAAFAQHPEQGALRIGDLVHRMRQPWFDPAGFFVAERDGTLVGFHWTKVHPAGEEGPAAVGEVYVVGVAPTMQGHGLGRALTLTGLHHLHDQALDEVMLYVDADNTAAVATYRKLGFETVTVDVVYEPAATVG